MCITFALAQRLYDCNLFIFSQSINTNRLVEGRRAFFNILLRRFIPSVLTWTVFYTMCLQVRRFLISAVCVLFLYFWIMRGHVNVKYISCDRSTHSFVYIYPFSLASMFFLLLFKSLPLSGKFFFSFSELRFPQWMIEPNPECLVNAKWRGFQFCTCKSSSSSSSWC